MKKRISNQKITPNLWFNTNAEEAVNFYLSIFKNSKISRIARYGKEGVDIHGMPEGSVMIIEFLLDGQEFVALNGGPHFRFNEAVSFIVNCDTQEEVDHYWSKLGEGGDPKAQMCGWLKDKFGLSWQVVPTILTELMLDKDPRKAANVMNTMLKMKKLDIAPLEEAYAR
ncbi:VOC family protein [Chitinophaga sp. XS-30]|uniref:VOC family protein n=1 Tax=Chitinophaga sp. XS-30 TaxID=2604421 RepID=UPI0011DD7263|nr:VOC family protein [Chitinophaga sp. XS-30]QEH42948.1 VOC family protein [Chitinophaga sp. XS-30]